MILQRLIEFAARGESLPPMYQKTRVKWLIDLDACGMPVGPGCVPLSGGEVRGRDRGKEMLAPHIVRTVKITPKLLADNAEYALGAGSDPKTSKRHQAFCDLVDRCAAQVDTPSVKAIQAFLRSYPDKAGLLPDEAEEGDVLTFRVEGQLPIELPEVQDFWARETGGETNTMQCLVCGRTQPVEARLPVKIKGIPGGQSSGTALISANNDAFESYGLHASLIAPTCRSCGEAFANAINQMVSDDHHHLRVGPAIFVFWTREGSTFSPATLLSQPQEEDVRQLLSSYRTAASSDGVNVESFYALSLSASGGRVVVRDWLDTTVPRAQANLARWFSLQKLVDFDGSAGRPLGVYPLAASLYLKSDQMVANVPRTLVRCALQGGVLPEWLLAQVISRNRAEQGVTRPRAALTKAVLVSGSRNQKEDYMEKLEPELKSPAYLCGRLLAELESAQKAAVNPKATLVDRYYGAASASPATVFGNLLRNLQAHMAKLRKEKPGVHTAIDRRLQEIMKDLPEFPRTLNLKEQALFSLGYYHQKAANRAAAIARANQKTTEEETTDEVR